MVISIIIIDMIKQTFNSEGSKDSIEVSYFKKSHKSNLDVYVLDDVIQHTKLIEDIVANLKNNGIQWICVSLNSSPIIPENTLFFKHEKQERICCHVEGFENFYYRNLLSIVDRKRINLDVEDNLKATKGWVVVQEKKKTRKNRYNSIKKEIETVIAKL